jgi:hypothetical protein
MAAAIQLDERRELTEWAITRIGNLTIPDVSNRASDYAPIDESGHVTKT